MGQLGGREGPAVSLGEVAAIIPTLHVSHRRREGGFRLRVFTGFCLCSSQHAGHRQMKPTPPPGSTLLRSNRQPVDEMSV
jgi:hypothetical protein